MDACGKVDGKPHAGAKGGASFIANKILRWLNYTVLGASAVSIMCMLALRLVPTAWGWGFLSFSFLTIITAIVGCISATQEAARTMCYGLHMFLLITSTSIQGSVFLVFLSRPTSVLARLQSNRSEYDGRVLLKLDAAVLIGIFCIQLMILIMACLVHYCEPAYLYEDLEGNRLGRGRRLSRVQEETCAEVEIALKEEEAMEDKKKQEEENALKEKKQQEEKIKAEKD